MSSEGERLLNYVLGAHEEYDAVVLALQQCLWGTGNQIRPTNGCWAASNTNGISLLDIGAGSGHLLSHLVSELHIVKYIAFESDVSLARLLIETTKNVGKAVPEFLGEVHAEAFTSSTEVAIRADIVLICHSLYGQANKLAIIQSAARFVAKDGLLIVFH